MLPLVWSLLLVVFFSIPSGKRDVYLMPVLPMLALSIAPYWKDILQLRWLRRLSFALALLIGLAMLGTGAWLALGHSARFEEMLRQRELGDVGHAVWGMFVAIGAGFVLAAAAFRPRRGGRRCSRASACSGSSSVCGRIHCSTIPVPPPVSCAARELAGADTQIGLVAWKEQNLLMADGSVRDFGFRAPWTTQFSRAAQWLAEAPQQRRIFILEDAMKRMGRCIDDSRATRIGHANRRDWWLLGADAIVPGCTPSADAGGDEATDEAEP
jgi:hypothetical protein